MCNKEDDVKKKKAPPRLIGKDRKKKKREVVTQQTGGGKGKNADINECIQDWGKETWKKGHNLLERKVGELAGKMGNQAGVWDYQSFEDREISTKQYHSGKPK